MTVSRKNLILDKAMELVIAEGLDQLTMGKVARRVGFTEPAMYRHFANKQELVIQLIRRLGDGFDTVFRRFSPDAPPAVFFPAYFDALLEYLQRVRGVTFQFLSASAYNSDDAIRRELQDLFLAQLGRISGYLRGAAARGELRPGVDPEAAALCFMGIGQALVTRALLTSWRADNGGGSRQALDVFLKGVLA